MTDTVPAGRFVPVEPTEAMLRDGSAACRDFHTESGLYPRTKAVWKAMLKSAPALPTAEADELRALQERVREWTLECFGDEIACDLVERMDRFTEEALELVQSLDYTPDRAHALVDYVFGRDKGEPSQEVGGTMTTLAALCNVAHIDILDAMRSEVDRITRPEMVLKIRAKQAAKPSGSALPVALATTPETSKPDTSAAETEERFDYISDTKARDLFGTEEDDELPEGRVRVCAGEWVRIPGGYYFDASAGLLHPETATPPSSADDRRNETELSPDDSPEDVLRKTANIPMNSPDYYRLHDARLKASYAVRRAARAARGDDANG